MPWDDLEYLRDDLLLMVDDLEEIRLFEMGEAEEDHSVLTWDQLLEDEAA